MRKFVLGLALLAGAATAQVGPVQIDFGKVEEFADFGDSRWDRERNQKDFEAMLREATAALPAGRQLSIKVLDVNLAGELEWWWSRADRLRVMRSVTWPMIEMEYALSEGGRTLKSGTVRLADMNYLQNDFFSVSQSSTAMRYERRLLDRWFKEQILGK
ncbi:MAG: DUF3016 domain-containing protein [Burkholderiales bacterium]|uniref:DUF3016 domain-containing protein n=1 Tax=Inhella sp. TaxID=1921806 RepID=UPI001ACDAE8B|nr:DUF3016 domain-containing protein [Burkholderiales bacterium]